MDRELRRNANRADRQRSGDPGLGAAAAPTSQVAVLRSLQRTAGNRAVGAVLGSLHGPSRAGFVLQRKTPDNSDYTKAEKRAAIAHAKDAVTKKKPKDGDYGAAMAAFLVATYPPIATDYTLKTLEKACVQWWKKPSLVDDEAPAAEARRALAGPTLVYDAAHGDYHFIAKPTTKKSAWSLEKDAANQLVQTEIRKHLKALGEHSAGHEDRDGWSAFYITAQHNKAVGTYYVKGERDSPSTDHFTIQLQVHYGRNEISYHGFPDERIEGHALGCSINKTDAVKL